MRRCWARPKLDVARYTPLAKTKAVSQEQLDDAVQANLMAKAAVVADKAAVETARLNLGFTRITSPVDGVAGVAQAQIGDLVGPNTAVLTTVSTVNPIRAYFNISEQFYLAFFRPSAPRPGERPRQEDVPLQLILSDGSVYPTPGKWIITGRQVDVTTGTLQVAAEFDNPGNFLRPGQYGAGPGQNRDAKRRLAGAATGGDGTARGLAGGRDRRSQHRAHQDRPGGRANRLRLADRKRSATQRPRRCRRHPENQGGHKG